MTTPRHARPRRSLLSPSANRSQASLARSSAIMASGTLVSRILGLVRNALMVVALGATGSGAADAFNTANNLPTNLYNMMIGGVLNAILVPQIVRALRKRNGEELVNRLLTAAATVMLLLTCIMTAAAPLIFFINASSLASGRWQGLAFAFAFWFMPQIFFYGLYALWGQVLNARSSFGPYMWSPVLNNIISIASILAYLRIYGSYTEGQGPEVWDAGRITLIGAMTTLGIVAQALILYIPLVRSGFRPRIVFGIRGLGLGQSSKVAMWALLGVVIVSLSTWATSNLGSAAVTASELPEYADVIVPSTTMWSNAYLVYILPQSLVVTSIITALFTRMSEKASAGDRQGVRDDLSLGLRSAGVFTILATAGICVLAVPALQVFTPSISLAEAQASAPVLVFLALGIVPQGFWFTAQRVMLAYEDTKRLLIADTVAGVLPMLICGLAYLAAPANHWMAWAALANTLSQVAACVVVVPLIRRHLPSLDGRRVTATHVRLVIAVAPAVIVGLILLALMGPVDAEASLARLLGALVQVLVVATLMSLIYLVMGRVVHVEEIVVAFRPVSRIVGKLGRLLPGPLGRSLLSLAAWMSPPPPPARLPPPPPQADAAPASAPGPAGPHPSGPVSPRPSAQAPAQPSLPPALPPRMRPAARHAAVPPTAVHPAPQPPPAPTTPPTPAHGAQRAAMVPPPPAPPANTRRAAPPAQPHGSAAIPPPPPPPGMPDSGESFMVSSQSGHIKPVQSPQAVTMGPPIIHGQTPQGRRRMSEATPIGSGRYGLLGTLSTTLPRIVRHRGVDTILDREVTILVLTDASVHRDNVLDSASRAVLVEDERLQRVYDVERDEPSIIVTEPLTGRTFSALVSRGISPAQVRAIIGETAQALDAGARRGLHHLNLSPESIRVLPGGEVKVSGLGIESAALDLENRIAGNDPLAADRADARALVEILYYGLTGRWPGKRPGIPSAPRLGGVPVTPSTLVSGIDPILDDLCVRTWSGQPPISASEVARALGTWDPVKGYAAEPRPAAAPTTPPSPAAAPATTTGAAAVASAARGVLGRLRRSGAGAGVSTAPPARQDLPARKPILGASSSEAPTTVPGPSAAAGPLEEHGGGAAPQSAGLPGTEHQGAAAPEPIEGSADREQEYVQVTGPINPIPSVLTNVSETAPATAPVPAEPFTGSFEVDFDDYEEDDPEVTRSVSRTTTGVIIVMVAALVIGVGMAVASLLRLAGVSFTDPDQAAAETVPSASQSVNGTGDSAQPGPQEEPAAPITVASTQAVDPSGNRAHPELVHLLTDGATDRPWFTQYHNDPDLGGNGLGVAIILEQPATVSRIEMQGTGQGGHVQIRATTPEDPQGGTVLAEGEFTQGTTSFDLTPAETSSIVIWVTYMPRSSDGDNKATISEITLQ
ncbi:lipid II flippase MurJ [Actinomyces bowdenii]|uniref:Murein biosynthesis integral membrane protein MurJ n=1 Tax=Actinomyces bowdenii TaxID=131109 RepID=A0A3P1V7L4_9ACTO|nr:lipid II flippase MurJ [Actinomyces bowdenii]RRD30182.1 hypothetical protein EII10_03710 [Actinomyces bowdenii]